jgi:hypothetical protein
LNDVATASLLNYFFALASLLHTIPNLVSLWAADLTTGWSFCLFSFDLLAFRAAKMQIRVTALRSPLLRLPKQRSKRKFYEKTGS